MGLYKTYVLVPKGTQNGSNRERGIINGIAEYHNAWHNALSGGIAHDDTDKEPSNLLVLAQSYSTLIGPAYEAFLASESRTIGEKVSILMEPYFAELRVAPHRRECDCMLCNAVEQAKELPEWKAEAVSFKFTKKQFHQNGFELAWKQELLKLGTPDPKCDECGGTGFTISKTNPSPKWDRWEIGIINEEWVLKGSARSPTDKYWVPVKDLDLDKIQLPSHIVTPDGRWLCEHDYVWFGSAVVIDEDWEQTTKEIFKQHQESTLAVVNIHY